MPTKTNSASAKPTATKRTRVARRRYRPPKRTLKLHFNSEYRPTSYVGRCSAADVCQALVNSHNRLTRQFAAGGDHGEKKGDSSFPKRLYGLMTKHIGLVKDIHKLCFSVDEDENPEDYNILSHLFYTRPHLKVDEFPSHLRSQIGRRPHLMGLTETLHRRMQWLSNRYSDRTYNGNSWEWFDSVCDQIENLTPRAEAFNTDISDAFEEYRQLQKEKRQQNERPRKVAADATLDADDNDAGNVDEEDAASTTAVTNYTDMEESMQDETGGPSTAPQAQAPSAPASA